MRLRKPGSKASEASRPTASERAAERAARKQQAPRPAGRQEALKARLRALTAGTASPRPAGRREDAADQASGPGVILRRSAAELVGIARELVRIPAAIYMRIAERLGEIVLAAWLRAWPYLVRLWDLLGRALAYAERVVTPARAAIAVALACALALGASQFADLSATSVGVDAYEGLEDVVAPSDVTTKTVGDAHAWVGVPLALLAFAIVIGCARGRPELARLLVPIGLVVIAISIFVDRPEGLDEGNDAIAYESVDAELLSGFWAQLVSGGVLILLAFVLTRVLRERRPERGAEPAKSSRSRTGLLRRLRSGVRRPAEAGR